MLGRIWRNLSRPNQKVNQSPYTPMTKHYVFNETGNIMLCATADSIQNFDEDIKDAFIDVSVFFSAMTKAIHSTTNPVTGKPFSIYNYQAVKNVLHQSGMFIEVNVENGLFSSKGVGAPMGKALIQAVLNREFSESQLAFSKGMFNGMEYQEMGAKTRDGLDENKRKLCRNGNIFFVCELLLGLPQTTAILVNIEPHSFNEKTQEADKDAQDIFNLGKKNEKTHLSKGNQRLWKYKKRTYLFVPPKFIKNKIANLKDTNSQEFEDMIESITGQLQSITNGQNSIQGV